MPEADLCDRLVLMFAGRVVADATPARMKAEFTAKQGALFEVNATQPTQALAALHDAGFSQAVQHGRQVRVTAMDRTDAAAQRIGDSLRAAGLADARVARRAPTMEDVFVQRVLALEADQRSARDAHAVTPA
jgi:drug efflux transport system ATP-binding protein